MVEGKAERIADSVYVIPDQGKALVPNVGIIIGRKSVLVVDTGMGPENAQIVLDEVRRLSDLPIKFLVSTHFHPEHNFGAQTFPQETILIYPEAQHQDLLNKGEHYLEWFVELFGDDVRGLLEPVTLIPPDVTFERQANMDLGGLRVELYYFGQHAHTGGDTIIFLPEQKIAFVGGLAPNGFFLIMPDQDSSVSGWIKTLESLNQLGATIIIPGHGKIGGTELIEAANTYLEAVWARASKLRSQGVPLESAQQSLYSEFTAEHPKWGEPYWINNAVERVYAESLQAN